jgi:dephospho-CoA kinase
MLRVGLTGGIGSGKSTVAQRFRELGAVVIDADRLAREVVAGGSSGLAAIRERFGDTVLAADGSLDRGALGEIVFADPQAREDLEAITHPLIGARTRSLMASVPPGQIVVHDVPLLVELNMAAAYHLTVVVGADDDTRMARLTGTRGLTEGDARARIAVQASDQARHEAADAWLDNNGTVGELLAHVDTLWQGRIVGFNSNILSASRGHRPAAPTLVSYDDAWPASAARLIGRINVSLKAAGVGEKVVAVEHIGSTSVPGLTAKDVIDLQVGVQSLSDADAPEFVRALTDKGFPRLEGKGQDTVHPWALDPAGWTKRFHANADPGRLAHVHVRQADGPGWRYALLFRDWLRAEAAERDDYAERKRRWAEAFTTTAEYAEAKEPWFGEAFERADAWARHTGWSVS